MKSDELAAMPPDSPERVRRVLRYIKAGACVGLGDFEWKTIIACMEARELDCAHGMLQTKDAEIERLSEALIRYGGHINDCPKNLLQPDFDWAQACTCGFSSGPNSSVSIPESRE